MSGVDGCDLLLLAAGFGTRLRPLTDQVPKPLLTVAGKTLLERNIELAARAGFRKIFINLHWLGKQIQQYAGDGSRWGLDIEYSLEDPILDTGGAIRQLEPRLSGDILMTINSDIIVSPDCDLAQFIAAHRGNPVQPIATMVVVNDAKVKEYGAIGVLPSGEVGSFVGTKYRHVSGNEEMEDTVYSGIQILSRRVLTFMPEAGIPFGITRQTYPRMFGAGERIWSVRFRGYWNDVGTPDRLAQASKDAVEGGWG